MGKKRVETFKKLLKNNSKNSWKSIKACMINM